MFDGVAEEAMNFYISLFEGSEVRKVERYGPSEPVAEGTLKTATFTLLGQEFMCLNSPTKHGFSFTPAVSLFVECDSPDEQNEAFGRLAEGGFVLMPLNHYGFSTRFGWVNDRFGVSWQLNLV